MFIQCKNQHDILPYLYITGGMQRNYGFEKDGKQSGIGYFDVTLLDQNILSNFIPDRYIKNFLIYHMKINSKISPHIDSGIKTTLNFYIKTNECETVFYSIKENAQSFKLENQTNGSSYNYNDLEKMGSFVARDNEVWLLDVTIPHSIETANTNIYRHAIVAQTDVYSFEEAKAILQETNNI
jgi:hypothetical protein